MKKLLFALLSLFFSGTEIKAQYNIIKIDGSLLNPIEHQSIHLERTINWNTSIEFGLGRLNSEEISAIHGCFSLRKYKKRNSPEGLYGGPYASFEIYNIGEEKYTVSHTGIIIGYQYIIRENLTIDFFSGYVYSLYLDGGLDVIPTSVKTSPLSPLEYGLRIGFAIPKGVPFIGSYF